MKKMILNTVISASLAAAAFYLFPIHYLTSNEAADNPQGCPYYITLQSILTNYGSMSHDKANAAFIKNKLTKFESDVVRTDLSKSVTAPYKIKYDKILDTFRIQSAAGIDALTAVSIAKKSYPVLDGFYTNEKLFCRNPMYSWENNHSRRVLHYNFGGLFDQLPNRFSRIQFVSDSGAHLGVFPGFLVNNQTTALGTQFMTGLPLLTALYVIPGYSFNRLGSYQDLVPWCAFWSGYITDKNLRKIMNIVGIDVFVASMKDVSSRIAKKEIKGLPNVVPLKSGIKKEFIENNDKIFLNPESYGLIYLANNIHYENRNEIGSLEASIKKYYARPMHRDPAVFIAAREAFYGKLYTLKNKHDVILESDQNPRIVNNNTPAGTASIQGLTGGRILASADCNRENCTLVLNVANSPGWHVLVNDSSSKIERANFAFMSTTIPKGKSFIWFIYEPMSQVLSYLLSMFTLLFILTLTLLTILQEKNDVKAIEKSDS